MECNLTSLLPQDLVDRGFSLYYLKDCYQLWCNAALVKLWHVHLDALDNIEETARLYLANHPKAAICSG